MKKLIYTRPDGGVSVVHPAPNDRREGESEDDFLFRVRIRSVPPECAVQIVDESAIPKDRTFRNAWVIAGDLIDHDMQKCREIQQTRFREARAPLLAALDVEFMRALETGDAVKQAEVVAQKQALRDVTKDASLDSAVTPEQLKAVWPAILGARP